MTATTSSSAKRAEILDVTWPWAGKTDGFSLEKLDYTTSFGVKRTVSFYIPASAAAADGPVPLVVDFHALSSDPFDEAYLTQLPALADKEGFVAAFPQGVELAIPVGPGYSWNAGACCPWADSREVNDIGMVRELPGVIANEAMTRQNVTIDRSRIYAMGMSNGGFMTNRVACEASDIFAAFAPVSGLYAPGPSHTWPSKPYACAPNRTVPILHFHGTSDPIVPLGGDKAMGFPAVSDYAAGWVARNKIDSKAHPPVVSYQKGGVTCRSWGSGGRSNVTLCLAAGAGHSWPGSTAPLACPDSGPFECTKDIEATTQIWSFFQRYRL
eukprot:g4441.t1